MQLTGAWLIICWARLPPLPLAIAMTSGRAEWWPRERGEGAEGASGAAALLRREIELVFFVGGISMEFEVHWVSFLFEIVELQVNLALAGAGSAGSPERRRL